jgi:hypothetical protein
MHQRKFIVGSLILFFFILTGGLTSCALFENSSSSDLTNAVGMSGENGPGSGQWIPPQPKNRDQCLQLHATGVTLKNSLQVNIDGMEPIRKRCVDENGEFLPNVNKAECIQRFNEYHEPAQWILTDLAAGGVRYTQSCTTAEGGSTLPDWSVLAEKDDEEKPEATVVPEATKEPAEEGSSWPCCQCLTCTQHLDTGYVLRPLIITPKG